VVVAQKVSLAAPPGEHLAVFVTAEPLPAIGLSIGLEASRRLSLPPPDLVTTLGVLLI
jgi:hypothetical protein